MSVLFWGNLSWVDLIVGHSLLAKYGFNPFASADGATESVEIWRSINVVYTPFVSFVIPSIKHRPVTRQQNLRQSSQHGYVVHLLRWQVWSMLKVNHFDETKAICKVTRDCARQWDQIYYFKKECQSFCIADSDKFQDIPVITYPGCSNRTCYCFSLNLNFFIFYCQIFCFYFQIQCLIGIWNEGALGKVPVSVSSCSGCRGYREIL